MQYVLRPWEFSNSYLFSNFVNLKASEVENVKRKNVTTNCCRGLLDKNDSLHVFTSSRFSSTFHWQSSFDDGQHIILTHNDQLFPIQLDFGSGVGGEDDFVALLDREGGALAGFQAAAVADRQDLAALGLFLGRVGKDDAGFGLGFGFETLPQNFIPERTSLEHDTHAYL